MRAFRHRQNRYSSRQRRYQPVVEVLHPESSSLARIQLERLVKWALHHHLRTYPLK